MHFHSTHVALGNLDTKETLKTLLKGRCQLIMAIHLSWTSSFVPSDITCYDKVMFYENIYTQYLYLNFKKKNVSYILPLSMYLYSVYQMWREQMAFPYNHPLSKIRNCSHPKQ